MTVTVSTDEGLITVVEKPELLAPAGGFEQLEYALYFGADAVYVGGDSFGLRKRADNFSNAELSTAVRMVHEAGKKIFVTVNALMHNDDIAPLREYLTLLGSIDVDAVILSDFATLQLAKEVAPDVAIHVSTQASCTNYMAANLWHELGAKRIVLARELSLEEIRVVRENVPPELELEVFVHGAMCMAYSGRCLISNYLTHRDANRGNCTQPCRWKYTLQEETRPGVHFPIEEDGRGAFLMSSKDLAMIEHLDDLAKAGIDSIKVEGRVKSAYYVATVVNAYRQVLDGALAQEFLPELDAVSHRPYHTGFFYGPADQSYEGAEYLQTHDWVATVLSCEQSEDGSARVNIAQRNRFFEGDELEVLSPGFPVRKVQVRNLSTAFGQQCEVANRACEKYSFESSIPLLPHDLLRRKREDIAIKG